MIEGYAALFGEPDQIGDVIRSGAFRESLARRRNGLPMLLEHDERLRAGVWSEAVEDGRGLYLRGEIDPRLPGAARAALAIARGVDGLSIGFVTLVSHCTPKGRTIEEVDLLEASIVMHPMQPLARLTPTRSDIRAFV